MAGAQGQGLAGERFKAPHNNVRDPLPAGRTKESQRESVKKANCKTSSKQTSNICSGALATQPLLVLRPRISTHKVATRSQTQAPPWRPPLKLVNRKCNSMHLMLATVAAAASPAEWKSASTPPATHLPGKYPLEIGRPCRCLLFYEFRLHPADVLHCRSCLSCLPNPCKQVKNVVKQTTVQKVGGHDGCVCGFYCRILFRGLTNGKGIQ